MLHTIFEDASTIFCLLRKTSHKRPIAFTTNVQDGAIILLESWRWYFPWCVWQVLRKVSWDKYVDAINVDDYRGQTVIFVVIRPCNFHSRWKTNNVQWVGVARWLRFVDISGIIDHQYLSFLFIVLIREVHMNMTSIANYINLSLLSVLKLLCRQRCGFISLLISVTY